MGSRRQARQGAGAVQRLAEARQQVQRCGRLPASSALQLRHSAACQVSSVNTPASPGNALRPDDQAASQSVR